MKYLVIADSEKVRAFSLLGVEGIAVSSEEEADKALDEAIRNPSNGAVLIEAETYLRNAEKISAHESTGRYPVVLKLDSTSRS